MGALPARSKLGTHLREAGVLSIDETLQMIRIASNQGKVAPRMATISKALRNGRQYINPVPTSVGGLSTMVKILRRYLTSREERVPKQPLGPFRTDARLFETPPASGLRVTWMGHSSSLVEIDGTRVLIDPVWELRAAPVEWAGPKRFFAPPLRLEDLPSIDVVLLSHDHYDHLGAGTVRRLAKSSCTAEAQWISALGVGTFLKRLGVQQVHELNWTESVTVGSLTVTALPARHFSGRSLAGRFETLWASFVLAGEKHRVYYGADSGEWAGFTEIGQTHGPFDLSMLEIGAFDPMWSDIHMGPDGAVRTFRALGAAGLLMPIHWGLFNLALHGWRQPIERLTSVDGLPIWSPEPGMPSEVVKGVELRSAWWQR
jgi:L-ascorbate metabolism protein UlaG (beta-lactamase superfamily)